jgi:hypothetical protein
MGMAISVFGSQLKRNGVSESLIIETSSSNTVKELANDLPHRLLILTIDRWLGLEGVMAVSAYPNKSVSLFIKACSERRTKDKADLYTGEISKSGFTDAKTVRYSYATMPGAIAFLYLSSSYSLVFIGMFFLTAVLILSEWLIFQVTNNPFLCSLAGMYMSSLINQLGAGGLIQPFTTYLTTMIFAIVLGLLMKKINHLATYP